MPPLRPLRILLAEDDAALRDVMVEALAARGHRITRCESGRALLNLLGSALVGLEPMPDVIVTDDRMPGARGSDVLAGLHDPDAPLPVVLVSAFADDALHARARALGALLLEKPFEVEDLIETVERAADPQGRRTLVL